MYDLAKELASIRTRTNLFLPAIVQLGYSSWPAVNHEIRFNAICYKRNCIEEEPPPSGYQNEVPAASDSNLMGQKGRAEAMDRVRRLSVCGSSWSS